MMITSSIVAIAIFSTGALVIATLCRVYYKRAQTQTKYQRILASM